MYVADTVTTLPSDHPLAFDADALLCYLKKLALETESPKVIWPWISRSASLRVQKFTFGQSNPTYLVSCQGEECSNEQRFVLRRKPPGKLLRGAHQIEREFRVMSALWPTRVPVPECYHLCKDASVIGSAFYLCQFVDGVVYTDAMLPTKHLHSSVRRNARNARFAIYHELVSVLARIHSVNIHGVDLSDFARRHADGGYGDYAQRVLKTWTKQYESARMRETDDARIDELKARMCALRSDDANSEKIYCLTHGDFRMDNAIFCPRSNRVLAVIDWELSTIGHPLADLSSLLLPYVCRAPANAAFAAVMPYACFRGLSQRTLRKKGLPTELETFESYLRQISDDCLLIRESVFPLKDFNKWLAIRLWTTLGIWQGVAKRVVGGNASNPLLKAGLQMKDGLLYFAEAAMYALDRADIFEALKWETLVQSGAGKSQLNALPIELEPFRGSLSAKYFELRRNLEYFLTAVIQPFSKKMGYFYSERFAKHKWATFPDLDYLKSLARELGLWNLFLPKEYFEKLGIGAGLSNLEYASLCELSGRFPQLCPEAMNCSAPDTGNMEVLARYGDEWQRQTWLKPLLNGDIRSAFAMTEPLTASSDARNIECRIDKCGDGHYVVNGLKWWTSAALSPKCALFIVMGRSGRKRSEQSMIVVPANASGVRIVRHLTVFGADDAFHGGHAEVHFDNVKVPKTHVILGEGRGFEISQGRLGPGRIHHCMRLVGMAESALQFHSRRALTRFSFGSRNAAKGTTLRDLAQSRTEVETCRLLTLQTAALMDAFGNRNARQQISAIKVLAPNVATAVLDRAIQAHGAEGVSSDTPLAALWLAARALRIADGPDAVHQMLVGRIELKRAKL